MTAQQQISGGFGLLAKQEQAQKKQERENKLLKFDFFSKLISKNIDDPAVLGSVTKLFKNEFADDEEFGTFANALTSISQSKSGDPNIEAELRFQATEDNIEQLKTDMVEKFGLEKSIVDRDIDLRGRSGAVFVLDRDKSGKIGKITDEKPTGLTEEQRKIKSEIDIKTALGKATALEDVVKRKELRAVKRDPSYRGLVTGKKLVVEALDIMDSNPEVFRDIAGRQFGRTKEGAAFQTKMDTAIRQLVASISGKVVTDKEAGAYQKSFSPKFFNTPEVARQKLDELQDIFELNQRLLLNPDDDQVKKEIKRIVKSGAVKEGSISEADQTGKDLALSLMGGE